MKLPFVYLKSLILWAAFALAPVAVAWIFFKRTGAIAAFLLIGVYLLIDALRSEKRLRMILQPTPMQVGEFNLLAIEDPSSHAFVTHGLFANEPTLWITRGALSLFSPEEILLLLAGLKSTARNRGLRFATILTSWMIRFSSNLPSEFTEIVFFRQKRSKELLIRDSIWAFFWMSTLFVLERFYFAPRSNASAIPEEILRRMEAESRRCVPRLPVALSSHSVICPWPDAFLTFGRSCLHPSRAVNLGA